MKKIYVEGTGMVYEQTEILDNIRSYNEKLYKSTESNLVVIELGNLLNNYTIPKLDNETANGLENDILESEELWFWKKWKIINPQEAMGIPLPKGNNPRQYLKKKLATYNLVECSI